MQPSRACRERQKGGKPRRNGCDVKGVLLETGTWFSRVSLQLFARRHNVKRLPYAWLKVSTNKLANEMQAKLATAPRGHFNHFLFLRYSNSKRETYSSSYRTNFISGASFETVSSSITENRFERIRYVLSVVSETPEIRPSLIEIWHRVGGTRNTLRELPWSDKKDRYCRTGVASRILRFLRASFVPWKKEKQTWVYGRGTPYGMRESNNFRDLKTSCCRNSITHGRAREGSSNGNEGASSDWSSPEEIASRLVIITPLTQLPLPPIALSIIFVIELLATKSPFHSYSLSSLSFIGWRSSISLPSRPVTLFLFRQPHFLSCLRLFYRLSATCEPE